jgi:hypothetical protein
MSERTDKARFANWELLVSIVTSSGRLGVRGSPEAQLRIASWSAEVQLTHQREARSGPLSSGNSGSADGVF